MTKGRPRGKPHEKSSDEAAEQHRACCCEDSVVAASSATARLRHESRKRMAQPMKWHKPRRRSHCCEGSGWRHGLSLLLV